MRLVALLFLLSALSLAMDFHIADTRGVMHVPSEWTSAKAILLIFVATDCPVANSYVPEMNRIAQDYVSKGVKTYAVNADEAQSDAAVAAYATEYQYQFPLLLDHKQVLVQLADASVTPQAVILTPSGEVLYRGRIDNRVEDFGKQRPAATEFSVRDALNEVLAGRPVTHPRTKSVGCSINKLKGNS